jgi:hypothetical protein
MSDLQEIKEKLIKRINVARDGIKKLKNNGILSFKKKVKTWNIIKIENLEYMLNQLEQSINNESDEEILNIYKNWLEDIETDINILLKKIRNNITVEEKILQLKLHEQHKPPIVQPKKTKSR